MNYWLSEIQITSWHLFKIECEITLKIGVDHIFDLINMIKSDKKLV